MLVYHFSQVTCHKHTSNENIHPTASYSLSQIRPEPKQAILNSNIIHTSNMRPSGMWKTNRPQCVYIYMLSRFSASDCARKITTFFGQWLGLRNTISWFATTSRSTREKRLEKLLSISWLNWNGSFHTKRSWSTFATGQAVFRTQWLVETGFDFNEGLVIIQLTLGFQFLQTHKQCTAHSLERST